MNDIWNKWLKQSVFIYCILYTIATIINSVLYLINGYYEDPSGNWHELDRAIIVLIIVIAYSMIKNLKIKNYWIKALIVYIPTLSLAFVYIWLAGFRDTLANSAYRDIFLNYSIGFATVTVFGYIANILKNRTTKESE